MAFDVYDTQSAGRYETLCDEIKSYLPHMGERLYSIRLYKMNVGAIPDA